MPKDFLPRYMEIAESVAELIASGSLRPGDPIPSIRNASARHRVSKGTIRQAYGVLESRGMIEARPQSGFYVRARTVSPTELPRTALTRPRLVEIKRSRRVEAILSGQVGSPVISLGSSFPDQSLFPVQSLGRSMAACVRSSAHVDTIEDLQLGLPALRRAISQRYLELGYSVSADEILITCGGMEAISLSLQAVTQPNDMIVIDSPMFFSGLHLLRHLRLRPIEMPADPNEGLSLSSLDKTLRQQRVKACLLMTNCQNPLGFTMTEQKKRDLVALLQRHQVPLIENDVYAELQFGFRHQRAAKAFDKGGLVMHCGSFTKSLAPGYKVGWVAGGRFRDKLLSRKFASTLGTSMPPQRAIVHYLEYNAFDRHLRQLRQTLLEQVREMSGQSSATSPRRRYSRDPAAVM